MTDIDVTPAPVENTLKPRPRRRLRRALIVVGSVLGALALIAGALAAWFLWAPAPAEPELDAQVVTGSVEVDGMTREYLAVVPAALPEDAPVVFAFHGSRMDAAGMRAATGYRFDELAVDRGFVAVYPQGYEQTWHDCRAETPYPARMDDIDDVAFVEAMIDDLSVEQGTSTREVFATGLSNGGHLAYRLATEAPQLVRGVAAFAAAYPARENDVCVWEGTPVPTMIVLGDADPINPFEGGVAGTFGGSLGAVLSAEESAAFLADRNGDASLPESAPYANTDAAGDTDVTTTRYDGEAPVLLFAVAGGGHVVPNPTYTQPRVMGGTTAHLDGPLAAVEFFLGE
ncbi:alpha/beta hydrolase family esterase [Microbacterium hominis]|uniref:Dienelactone hydrolase family protein n=1 Tax=Microbacterium hominis TaxID=162426 RepID=A0A7D4UC90_9MICO|nr:dienelactone hydrolase family protein [Microbacterium hominis]QKJ20383.1 dienelactone hydrolase family protein [Microbacterium hominis]